MKLFACRAREAGKSLALVPTMGALHDGHLSLVRRAKTQCDAVAISIFVNPSQFGPSEDLGRYPRSPERDLKRLAEFNVNAVFTPEAAELYPAGFDTWLDPGRIATLWEGAIRPGHFRGVATIVLKLLNIARPDFAYFGQKDFQQALVVRRLARDLNLDSRIVICPTVRAADGVALSSRNAYLSPEERKSARLLGQSLERARTLVWGGETDPLEVEAEMKKVLAADGNVRVDYAAIASPESLQPVARITAGCVAMVAAHVSGARLIDNAILGPRDASEEQLLQAALGATPASSPSARPPGLRAENLRLEIEKCRDCAAISSIVLPPREFMVKYLKTHYPDLNAIKVLVIGRDAPWNPERYLYRNPGLDGEFLKKLYELVGVKDFHEFTARFATTDALRCHAFMTPVPEKALANCSRHLREELKLFPQLRSIVVLGDAACVQFQRFILGRSVSQVSGLGALVAGRGWASEEVDLALDGRRRLQVIYCYHPTGGYSSSPSIAHLLAQD